MIDNAIKGNFVSNPRLKCYYKCMMLMTKVVSKISVIFYKYFSNIDIS